ncbi:hypothetical protein ACFLQ0_04065 [Nitrospinota bacterium]
MTYHVLFVIGLSTRRVQVAGITPEPHGAFMMQAGRNLTDASGTFLLGKRFLIMDRDKKHSGAHFADSSRYRDEDPPLAGEVAQFERPLRAIRP